MKKVGLTSFITNLWIYSSILIGFTIFFSCRKDRGEPIKPNKPPSLCDSITVKFSTDIQPALQVCGGCHPTYTNYTGILPILDPPQGNGGLRHRVIEKKDMPPSGPLADSILIKIDCWLKAGAPNN